MNIRKTLKALGLVAIAAIAILAGPVTARAQSESHWLASGTLVPAWSVPSGAGSIIERSAVDISGKELRIGIGRGRRDSGDWGVSFVRKTVEDGSRFEVTEENCFGGQCLDESTSYVTGGVAATGLEIHKMWHFATIKDRMQIGMDFGGGVARLSGSVIETTRDIGFGANGARVLTSTTTIEPVSLEWAPLARIELALTGIVSNAFKVRVSGGVNLPGAPALSVTALYLFGSE